MGRGEEATHVKKREEGRKAEKKREERWSGILEGTENLNVKKGAGKEEK